MNYWVVCISEDNLKISLQQKVIGFVESKKTRAKAFKSGDQIVFYVSRDTLLSSKRVGKFIGLATIRGESYLASEREWDNGFFPVRVKIEPFSENSCDVRRLINRLHFIKNKPKWGSAFMPGIIRIAQDDFEIIRKCMEERSETS